VHVAVSATLTSFLGSFAKLQKVTPSYVRSVRPSVRPHGTTRLKMDGFSWKSIFENSKGYTQRGWNVSQIRYL